jgi:hypothetical protein
VTDFQIPAASGIINNAADFEGGASNQYLENTSIEGAFINTIEISGAGTTTSNGTYTRENGWTNQFFGPNGNYIYYDDPWVLYDNDFEGITYSTDDPTFATWDSIDGDAPFPSGVTYYSGFSISTWFKMKSHSSTQQTIWGTAGNNFISLYVKDGSVAVYDNNGTGIIQGPAVSLDTWYHAVVTYSPDSEVVLLFIDGENSGNMDLPPDWSWTGFGLSDFRIDGGNHGYSADASIGETGIWTRVLTEQEIIDLYNGGDGLSYGAGSFPTEGIYSYWTLGEASGGRDDSTGNGYILDNTNQGLTWADQSGNGNNAITRVGAPQLQTNVINGKPAIHLNGSSNLITNNFFAHNWNTPITIIAVSKASASTVRGGQPTARYISGVTYIGGYESGLSYGGYGTAFPNFSNSYGISYVGGADIESSPMGENEKRIASTINNGTEISFFLDGNLVGTADPASQSAGNNSTGAFVIGSDAVLNEADNFFCVCDIAEIIIYNRALTTPERQQVQEYLEAKYEIGCTDTNAQVWIYGVNGAWNFGPRTLTRVADRHYTFGDEVVKHNGTAWEYYYERLDTGKVLIETVVGNQPWPWLVPWADFTAQKICLPLVYPPYDGGATIYTIGDRVSHGGGNFVCIYNAGSVGYGPFGGYLNGELDGIIYWLPE